VLEAKTGGAFTVSRDDQCRDLDDLAFTARGRTGVLLRTRDVLLRGGPVAAVRGHDREQGLLDRVHRGRVLLGRATNVMTTRCARALMQT
jgi:hypothetical protein